MLIMPGGLVIGEDGVPANKWFRLRPIFLLDLEKVRDEAETAGFEDESGIGEFIDHLLKESGLDFSVASLQYSADDGAVEQQQQRQTLQVCLTDLCVDAFSFGAIGTLCALFQDMALDRNRQEWAGVCPLCGFGEDDEMEDEEDTERVEEVVNET